MRDPMFLYSLALQVDLLVVETEMQITKRANQAKQATKYPMFSTSQNGSGGFLYSPAEMGSTAPVVKRLKKGRTP